MAIHELIKINLVKFKKENKNTKERQQWMQQPQERKITAKIKNKLVSFNNFPTKMQPILNEN